MFDQYLVWLNSLTPAQKQELIDNITAFRNLQTYLEAKKCMRIDQHSRDFVIEKDCPEVEQFLAVAAKMTLKGVKIRDERPK